MDCTGPVRPGFLIFPFLTDFWLLFAQKKGKMGKKSEKVAKNLAKMEKSKIRALQALRNLKIPILTEN